MAHVSAKEKTVLIMLMRKGILERYSSLKASLMHLAQYLKQIRMKNHMIRSLRTSWISTNDQTKQEH